MYHSIGITHAQTDNLSELVRLYNAVTADLLAKGMKQWTYPWTMKQISPWLGQAFVIKNDHQIVGSFVLSTQLYPYCQSNELSLVLEKIAVLPDWQGKGLLSEVFDFVGNYAASNQKAVFFDCWSENDKLKKVYKSYACYCGDFDEQDYHVSVFQLK